MKTQRNLSIALFLPVLGTLSAPVDAQSPISSPGELILYGAVTVAPSSRAAFAEKMGAVALKTRAEQGCEFFTLSEDTARKGQFYIVEGWTSRQALENHLASPRFQAELKDVTAIPIEGFTLTRYVVASKEDGTPKK